MAKTSALKPGFRATVKGASKITHAAVDDSKTKGASTLKPYKPKPGLAK